MSSLVLSQVWLALELGGCRPFDPDRQRSQHIRRTTKLVPMPTMGSAAEVLGDRWWSSEAVVVVTGGNKGIGLEIVRRLALEGLTVILTCRHGTRGLKSTQSLHDQGLKNVVFHTLDISNSESRTQFKEWIQKVYGGLDILVNNAGVLLSVDNVYETAVETMKINYRGTIDLTEELLPLFKASQAGARIVNITSYVGKLMNVNDEQLRKKLSEVTQFDQKSIDELEQKYLEACRAGNGEPNGYSDTAYRFSKTLLNAYSRLLALGLANQPDGHKIYLHNVHPGLVRTDIYRKLVSLLDEETYLKMAASADYNHEGVISVEEGGRQPRVAVSGACWGPDPIWTFMVQEARAQLLT